MDIVCCIDNNFTIPCGVLMTSILENNRTENIIFHIITNDLSNTNASSLQQIATQYNSSINIYRIDDSILQDCPVRQGDHVSIATYFRILIPRILPTILDKVLYLDCDMVVTDNLSGLWNADIEHCAIGAIAGGSCDNPSTYERLQYPRELSYFNAGVLLINLKYWREHDIANQTLQFIKEYPERIKWWDQDALNYVLRETKLELPLKYNLQDLFLYQNPTISDKYKTEIEKAIAERTIIHFTSPNKPWYKECTHPLRSEYIRYLSLTEWKDTKPQTRNRDLFLITFIKRIYRIFNKTQLDPTNTYRTDL